ncbi:MAG: tyrosine-type recombinase/integrase [[Eubacterium] siraeum]
MDDRLKACGLAGKGISVHKLRHTAATLMYQNGVDVRVLKRSSDTKTSIPPRFIPMW